MGPMQTDQLACCYIIIHVAAISCQQPCHRPRKFTHHRHVSSHVSSMSLLCDMAIESVMKIILFVALIFVIKNGLGLGFGGPGTFHDGFKTSWIKQSMTKI